MSTARPDEPYSVIIPALNEAEWIGATVSRIRTLTAADVIVVDGGSRDGTRERAAEAGATVITAPRGRGNQCAAGALRARGDVLVFLHADTQLPDSTFEVIAAATRDDRFTAGTFRLAFDRRHWLLRLSAWLVRFDSMFTRFGDQGIVIRREVLDRVGGFPEVPLFEDVELLKRARQYGRIRLLPATVVTSARRFVARGVVRTQLLNVWLMLRYVAGASPQSLAAQRESFFAVADGGSPLHVEAGK